ncbi:MAG: HlyD family efflux transporter periplasmic adaptor subunit, partial [Oscillospiraceae bacterium]
LLIAVYVFYQIYMIAYPTYKTEIAMAVTISDSIKADGIVVRNETIIENSGDGIINFLVGDGDKVAIGAPVAEIYVSNSAAANALLLENQKDELDILTKAVDLGRASGTNLNFVSRQISNVTARYAGIVATEDYSSLLDEKNKILQLLNSFAIASGKEIDFTARIDELNAKIAEVSARDSSVSQILSSPSAGYFISTVDGYEESLNDETLHNMTTSELIELVKQAQLNTQIDESHCKMVSDYKWLYAAVVSKEAIGKFSEGSKYSLDFDYAMVSDLPVTVEKIIYADGDDFGTVIFECDYLNPSISALRAEQATINFTQYDGIKADRSALRLVDGVTGVYVKYGSTVSFKRTEKIYETEDYVLSRIDPSDKEMLALYDEIIVEGKDIYEGKDLGKIMR